MLPRSTPLYFLFCGHCWWHPACNFRDPQSSKAPGWIKSGDRPEWHCTPRTARQPQVLTQPSACPRVQGPVLKTVQPGVQCPRRRRFGWHRGSRLGDPIDGYNPRTVICLSSQSKAPKKCLDIPLKVSERWHNPKIPQAFVTFCLETHLFSCLFDNLSWAFWGRFPSEPPLGIGDFAQWAMALESQKVAFNNWISPSHIPIIWFNPPMKFLISPFFNLTILPRRRVQRGTSSPSRHWAMSRLGPQCSSHLTWDLWYSSSLLTWIIILVHHWYTIGYYLSTDRTPHYLATPLVTFEVLCLDISHQRQRPIWSGWKPVQVQREGTRKIARQRYGKVAVK